jgi:ATP-dependent RNA helicase DDX21
LVKVPPGKKIEYVRYLAAFKSNGGKTMIFTNTKVEANEVSSKLGLPNVLLHGDIPQESRNLRLKKFKEGKVMVLVATNVAARGLDIPNVELIINYDIHENVEAYTHRSGRTGRAGKAGLCVSLTSNYN